MQPRFLDTVQFRRSVQTVTQAAPGSSPSAHVINLGTNPGDDTENAVDALDAVKHYTDWTFVAVSKIVNRCCHIFPSIGTAANLQDGQQSVLSDSRRQYIRENYGRLQTIQEELVPIPDDHVFSRLLRKPNPDQMWSEFAEETLLFWLLTGDFYWWIIRDGLGVPCEIWNLEPQWVTPVRGRDRRISHYKYQPNGVATAEMIPADNCIRGKFPSPLGRNHSHSALRSGARWVNNSRAIEVSREKTFKNGPNPSALVKLTGEHYAGATDDSVTELKQRIKKRIAGLDRHGEVLVSLPGMDLVPWSMKPVEMDFSASADQLRNNILALWGVPPVMAGIATEYNRATAEAGEYVFCDVTINPLLKRFANYLTFLGWKINAGIFVWFDDCRPANPELELQRDRQDFDMGAKTPNEQRTSRNRTPIDDPAYDTGYLNGGKVPLSAAAMPDDEIR